MNVKSHSKIFSISLGYSNCHPKHPIKFIFAKLACKKPMAEPVPKDVLLEIFSFFKRLELDHLLIVSQQFRHLIQTSFSKAPRRLLTRLRVNYTQGQSFPVTAGGDPQAMLTLSHNNSETPQWWPSQKMHTLEVLLPYLAAGYTKAEQTCLTFSPSYFLYEKKLDSVSSSKADLIEQRIDQATSQLVQLKHLWYSTDLVVEFQMFRREDKKLAEQLFACLFQSNPAYMESQSLDLCLYYNTTRLAFPFTQFPIFYTYSKLRLTLGDIEAKSIVDYLHALGGARQQQEICLNLEYSHYDALADRWECFQFDHFVDELQEAFLEASTTAPYKLTCEFFDKFNRQKFILFNPTTNESLSMVRVEESGCQVVSKYCLQRKLLD